MRPNRCSSEEFMQILEDRISNLEQDNNYVTSSQIINAAEVIDDAIREALWDIADRYVTSYPVSGDWETETPHLMQAIQDEIGVDADTAQRYMIEVLGYTPEDFKEEEFEAFNRPRRRRSEVEQEVLDVLARNGYDVSTEAARNLASAAAEYICLWAEEDDYNAARWFEDTKRNYPEDLEAIESACNTTGMPAAVTQLDDADKIEGCGINCSTSLDGLITV